MKISRLLYIFFLASSLQPAIHAQDSWQEAKSFSAIEALAPQSLTNGVIKCSQVPMTGSALNISTESNYLLPISLEQAVEILRNFNTVGTELDRMVDTPPTAENFQRISVTNTALKTTNGLNLTNQEKSQLSAAFQNNSAETINKAWRNLLLNRTAAFQTGGLVKAAPYDLDEGGTFNPAAELVSMLKQRAPVLKRFVSVLDQAMTTKPNPNNLPVAYYWESEQIQRNQNLALGASFAQRTASGYQLVDLTYYSASSYYLSLSLYEFWPVTVNGKSQTYVWRGDYVLSPSIGHAKGIERMAAENIMILEVRKTINDQIKRCAQESQAK